MAAAAVARGGGAAGGGGAGGGNLAGRKEGGRGPCSAPRPGHGAPGQHGHAACRKPEPERSRVDRQSSLVSARRGGLAGCVSGYPALLGDRPELHWDTRWGEGMDFLLGKLGMGWLRGWRVARWPQPHEILGRGAALRRLGGWGRGTECGSCGN